MLLLIRSWGAFSKHDYRAMNAVQFASMIVQYIQKPSICSAPNANTKPQDPRKKENHEPEPREQIQFCSFISRFAK